MQRTQATGQHRNLWAYETGWTAANMVLVINQNRTKHMLSTSKDIKRIRKSHITATFIPSTLCASMFTSSSKLLAKMMSIWRSNLSTNVTIISKGT